jgi:hypothetical protein
MKRRQSMKIQVKPTARITEIRKVNAILATQKKQSEMNAATLRVLLGCIAVAGTIASLAILAKIAGM